VKGRMTDLNLAVESGCEKVRGALPRHDVICILRKAAACLPRVAQDSPVCSSQSSESAVPGKANLRIGLKSSEVDWARQTESWRSCALRCHVIDFSTPN
jgi:hypothetical protein